MLFKLFTLKMQPRKTSDSILSVYFYVAFSYQGRERGSYPMTCHLKFFIVFLHPISTFTFYSCFSMLKKVFSCGLIADGVGYKETCEEKKWCTRKTLNGKDGVRSNFVAGEKEFL